MQSFTVVWDLAWMWWADLGFQCCILGALAKKMCPSGSPLLGSVLVTPGVIQRTPASGGVPGEDHRSDLGVAGTCGQAHLP